MIGAGKFYRCDRAFDERIDGRLNKLPIDIAMSVEEKIEVANRGIVLDVREVIRESEYPTQMAGQQFSSWSMAQFHGPAEMANLQDHCK